MTYTTRTIQARGIWQGEDVTWAFLAEADLSDGDIEWKLTTQEGGGAALLTKAGAISGYQFTVTLTDTETNVLTPGFYWHEVKFTSVGGEVSQLVAFADTETNEEVYILLKPGQSAAVICDDHQSSQVNFLRVGGARVICPLPDDRKGKQ
jgi:hypothetical protein